MLRRWRRKGAKGNEGGKLGWREEGDPRVTDVVYEDRRAFAKGGDGVLLDNVASRQDAFGDPLHHGAWHVEVLRPCSVYLSLGTGERRRYGYLDGNCVPGSIFGIFARARGPRVLVELHGAHAGWEALFGRHVR